VLILATRITTNFRWVIPAEAQGTILFLDIRGFTKLSLALPNKELVDILQAMTVASVRAVHHFGGHVIEFTGDGVMATFGDAQSSPEFGALAALQTTATLMVGVREYVNPQLEQLGTEPIRTAIGMEFGKLLWSRIGIGGATQVKPISDVTFLAGKISSKFTNAWESKVGPGLALWIPTEFKDDAEKYEFTLNKKAYSRELFLFKWEEFSRAAEREPGFLKRVVERKLSPTTISAARIVTPGVSSGSQPHKLKDQPFF
jgi:adenylate cyclase